MSVQEKLFPRERCNDRKLTFIDFSATCSLWLVLKIWKTNSLNRKEWLSPFQFFRKDAAKRRWRNKPCQQLKRKANCNNRNVSKLKAGNNLELFIVECKAQTQSSIVHMFTATKNLSLVLLLKEIEHAFKEKMLDFWEDRKIKANFETSGQSEYWVPAWTNIIQKLILFHTRDKSQGDFDGKKLNF